MKIRPLIHVYSHFPGVGDTKRRNDVAKMTWEIEYSRGPWIPFPIFDKDLKRNSKSIGDPKSGVPFIKDMVDMACERGAAEDCIVLTNTDTCFSAGITEAILTEMDLGLPISAHRYDHANITRQMTPMETLMGDWYCGADLFCFTRQWWLNHRGEYPDMLMGYEAWDWIMRELCDKHEGVRWQGGQIGHIKHAANWYQPGVKNSHPCQLHNVRLAKAWLTKNNKAHRELTGR